MVSHERLCTVIEENNWDLFIDILKPKYFPRDEKGNLIERKILAKVAETLTTPKTDVPCHVQITLLKCLLNSCVDGYTNEKQSGKDNDEPLQNYCNQLYSPLSTADSTHDNSTCFPYDGTVVWAVDYILRYIENPDDDEDCLGILRLSVQFLCNLSTFACDKHDLPASLYSHDFKLAVTTLAGSNHVPVSRAACAFVHNALKSLPENYYNEAELKRTAEALIEANESGIQSARESIILLSKRPGWLKNNYQELSVESKLRLLEIIHQDVRESVYSKSESEKSTNFPGEVVEFLSERFRKRSDLILKTVNSYLDGVEPMEVTLLLDIICVISSEDSVECRILQNDKSLMINCIFLLKSVHMAGKASENYFTPVQKLSEIAPHNQKTDNSSVDCNVQNHPAFGFKAGLIRAIGNLMHKHEENQQLLRETDAIPLLLDCCNIDARNPRILFGSFTSDKLYAKGRTKSYCLQSQAMKSSINRSDPVIMQWAIFALRNVCDNSPENQEIIRNCTRVGIIDNDIIREMGMTLQEGEDGKAIGILPLPRNK